MAERLKLRLLRVEDGLHPPASSSPYPLSATALGYEELGRVSPGKRYAGCLLFCLINVSKSNEGNVAIDLVSLIRLLCHLAYSIS